MKYRNNTTLLLLLFKKLRNLWSRECLINTKGLQHTAWCTNSVHKIRCFPSHSVNAAVCNTIQVESVSRRWITSPAFGRKLGGEVFVSSSMSFFSAFLDQSSRLRTGYKKEYTLWDWLPSFFFVRQSDKALTIRQSIGDVCRTTFIVQHFLINVKELGIHAATVRTMHVAVETFSFRVIRLFCFLYIYFQFWNGMFFAECYKQFRWAFLCKRLKGEVFLFRGRICSKSIFFRYSWYYVNKIKTHFSSSRLPLFSR